MSFVRPELAARFRTWREPIAWGALVAVGLWLAWYGYRRLDLLLFVLGLVLVATGLGLLRGALRRLRLHADQPGEGVVVIDEARIAYLGPRGGGFVDLPAIARVEIVTRPHVPPRFGACLGDHRRRRHPARPSRSAPRAPSGCSTR